jgi:hypothetical protein
VHAAHAARCSVARQASRRQGSLSCPQTELLRRAASTCADYPAAVVRISRILQEN